MRKLALLYIAFILVSPVSAQAASVEPDEAVQAETEAQLDDVQLALAKSLEAVKASGQFDSAKKGQLIQEKKEFLEKLTQIIDQKLSMLGKQNIALCTFDEEIARARTKLKEFRAEKQKHAKKINLLEQKIKSINQDIAIKKQLLELNGGKEAALEKSIAEREKKLKKYSEDLDVVVQRQALVDLKFVIAQDYLKLMHRKKQKEMLRQFFTPKMIEISKTEALWHGLIVLIFGLAVFFRKKISAILFRITRSEGSIQFFKFLLYAFGSSYGLFWALSLSGFHLMALNRGRLLLFTAGAFLGLFIVYRLVLWAVRLIFVRDYDPSAPSTILKVKHPFFHFTRTLLRLAFAFAALRIALEIFGWGREGLDYIWQALQYKFFEAGGIKLSGWLITKVLLIVWIFINASRIIDHLLYSKVYPHTRLDKTVQYAFSVIIKYMALIIAAFTGLKLLGVEIGALTVLAGTVGIGIGFGLQEIAKNFISGLIILVERPIKIGDFIEVGGLPGKVKSINARSTVVDTFDNISVVVPNAEFISQNVVNWSYSDKITRMAIKVGVAYGSNLDLVRDTLLEVAKKHPEVLKNPEPTVTFEEFGDSALTFTLQVWTDDPEDRREVKSDLNFMIDKAFREKDIEIPFPQQDLHIKSSHVNLLAKDEEVSG